MTVPQFYHCPLMTDDQGVRLAKRHDALSLRTLREHGTSASALIASFQQDIAQRALRTASTIGHWQRLRFRNDPNRSSEHFRPRKRWNLLRRTRPGLPRIAARLADHAIRMPTTKSSLMSASIIESELKRMSDESRCCLVVTTGGTGPAPRDVTPEATAAVCEKQLPGFGELMRSTSLRYVPTAILSRQIAGIRGQTLIVNLPGRPKAIRENLEAVFPAIPYCIDLIGGPRLETNSSTMKAFRPKS